MIRIKQDIIYQIQKQAERDKPIETCGYICGKDKTFVKLFPLPNSDNSREHFSFNPIDQFNVIKEIRRLGLDLVGVYHSHPETPARMSKEDIRLANDTNLYYLIFSLIDNILKMFRVDEEKKVTEILYSITKT